MITLDEYKEYLLNYYKYQIDSTLEKTKERELFLEIKYPDRYLNKVISDTYEFVKDIFKCETIKNGYCHFEIDYNTPFGISLNITGGGYSDYLYKDINHRIISHYILKRIFGDMIDIEIKYCEIEREKDDEDIYSFNYHYLLYMQGFPNDMDSVKEKIYGKEKQLNKVKKIQR